MLTPTSFSSAEMATRLANIRSLMAINGLDALITTNPANVRYTTGFKGEPRTLLITQKEITLYTSFRTLSWAEAQTSTVEIQLSTDPSPLESIKKNLPNKDLTIAVDQNITHQTFLNWQQIFAPHNLTTATPIEQTRQTKSKAEIEILSTSQSINESIFNAILPRIQPGMTERGVQGIILSEIAANENIDSFSFTPIVAAGPNAWEIHHLPDHTKIKPNDMLLIDLGVVYQGYASDMTRTVCLGKPTEHMREIYATVGQAQTSAIAAIKPGTTTKEIDQVARDIITKAGYGKTFTHGLGHSIGLETHDDQNLKLSPFTSETILKPGMAFTIEPGIYLQDQFGVRTEDIVIVTEEGTKNITNQSHQLTELSL